MRSELIDWLSQPQFTHALTLNINRQQTASLPTARRLFSAFCLEVDRWRTGKRRPHRLPTCMRFEAVAFAEHLDTNLHLHVAANFHPRHWGGRRFTDEDGRTLATLWRRVTKGSGTSEIASTRDGGWARYITKEWYRPGHDYMHSADFHDARYVVYSLPALDDLA